MELDEKMMEKRYILMRANDTQRKTYAWLYTLLSLKTDRSLD